jgi:hypothetical protein
MMLVTLVLVPPSCEARLPQKSSAATTTSFPLDDPDELAPAAHPTRATQTDAATADQRKNQNLSWRALTVHG